jgi:DNA-binding transcriptional regulator YiaG
MKYKSEIFEVVHQDATEMFKIGAISEEKMREFDEMCLAPEKNVSKTDAKTAAQKTKIEHADLVTA